MGEARTLNLSYTAVSQVFQGFQSYLEHRSSIGGTRMKGSLLYKRGVCPIPHRFSSVRIGEDHHRETTFETEQQRLLAVTSFSFLARLIVGDEDKYRNTYHTASGEIVEVKREATPLHTRIDQYLRTQGIRKNFSKAVVNGILDICKVFGELYPNLAEAMDAAFSFAGGQGMQLAYEFSRRGLQGKEGKILWPVENLTIDRYVELHNSEGTSLPNQFREQKMLEHAEPLDQDYEAWCAGRSAGDSILNEIAIALKNTTPGIRRQYRLSKDYEHLLTKYEGKYLYELVLLGKINPFAGIKLNAIEYNAFLLKARTKKQMQENATNARLLASQGNLI